MYRIDSVIHGMIRPLNHSHGSWVNGLYPNGGTQLNRNVSCRVPCVIRLATSPSQKTGAGTPTAIAITTQITAAPKTSDSVAGVAAAISGTTFTPWFE